MADTNNIDSVNKNFLNNLKELNNDKTNDSTDIDKILDQIVNKSFNIGKELDQTINLNDNKSTNFKINQTVNLNSSTDTIDKTLNNSNLNKIINLNLAIDKSTDKLIDNQAKRLNIDSIIKNENNENELNDEKFNLLFNDLINKAKSNCSKEINEKLNCSKEINEKSNCSKEINEKSNCSIHNSDNLSSIDIFSPSSKKLKIDKEIIDDSIDSLNKKTELKDQFDSLKCSNNLEEGQLSSTDEEEFNKLKSMLKDITAKGKSGNNKKSKKKINEIPRRSLRLNEIPEHDLLIRSNNNQLNNFEPFYNSSFNDQYTYNYLVNDLNSFNNKEFNNQSEILDFKTIDRLKKENKPTNLISWFNNQTKFFDDNFIMKDENKLDHTILHLDVRWFTDLEQISLNNNNNINYDLIKENLVQRCKLYVNAKSDSRRTNFIRSKYIKKVNRYINQIKFDNHFNLQIFLDWLKDLRRITDGTARDDFITELILNTIKNENKKIIILNLLKQIKFRIDQHNQNIKIIEKKLLNRFKLIREKMTKLLIDLNNEQFNNKY